VEPRRENLRNGLPVSDHYGKRESAITSKSTTAMVTASDHYEGFSASSTIRKVYRKIVT